MHHRSLRPSRDAALAILIHDSGLTPAEIASIDIRQLSPSGVDELKSAQIAEIASPTRDQGSDLPIQLTHEARLALAAYIGISRPRDADVNSEALFFSPRAPGGPAQRIQIEEVQSIAEFVRYESRTEPGLEISTSELDEIRILAEDWARESGAEIIGGQVVSAMTSVAISKIYGSGVNVKPDRIIYFTLLEGAFPLVNAAGRISSRREGRKVAIMMYQSNRLQIAGPPIPLSDNIELESLALGAVGQLTFE